MSAIIATMPIGVFAAAMEPVAVSPGGDGEKTAIVQECPVFSWSEAQWSVAYRVEVFKAAETDVVVYEDMMAAADPVVSVYIPGPALSWTPSKGECLKDGRSYVWYVGALDDTGGGLWSEGSAFEVDAALSAGLGDAVESSVRDYLYYEWTDTESYEEIKAIITEEVVKNAEAQGEAENVTQRGNEGDSNSNTYYGLNAGDNLDVDGSGDDAYNNAFFGENAGRSTTTGDSNAFVGIDAGDANTTGGNNTFIGTKAGESNETGHHNTFLGYNTGANNVGADSNTFLGMNAGYHNISGEENLFIGRAAGFTTETSSQNTFVGYFSGYDNTSGNENTFVGFRAGENNNTGYKNTFVGYNSGRSNTSGYFNSFLGQRAGDANITGNSNTFIGFNAGYSSAAGNNNTFIGRSAGYNASGSGNVFVGYYAGYNESGSNKLYIDVSNTATPLFYGEFDSNIVKIHGQLQMLSSGTTSDIRLKRDIAPLASSLYMVLALQGVSYHWRTEDYPGWGFKDTRQTGLVAQDVESVVPELVSTDTKGYKAVKYDKLTSVLYRQSKS